MTDFRALCAELHAAFNTYAVDMKHHDLLERARALLAEPEAEGPNDEEIISQADKFLAYSDAHMGDPARWEGSDVDLVAFTRHALSRWGRPAAAPVPEAEGPTDEELLASVRHFYGDQTAADMGAEDDLLTARAVLARWGGPR